MKKYLSALVVLVWMCVAQAAPRYVFLFIGDGMSTPQRMLAEEYARVTGMGELAMNHLPFHATTRTCSSSSLITDSAAAATAIACGVKTYNGAIGVDPARKPVASVAECAHRAGRKVGIVTTCTINHATPAGFYAHRVNRGLSYQIGLDLVASGFDYFAGGGFGAGKSDDKKDACYRGDLYDLARKAGYQVVRTRADLAACRPGGKVLFSWGEIHIQQEIDRREGDPSLAELTAKGIELLDGPDGFFMMVEGGTIDWAGHSNDAATNLRETLDLDRAVRVALDFQKRHPKETLIVVTGDHETGGMTMGFAKTGYTLYLKRLAGQKCSIGKFASRLKAAQKAAARDKKPYTFDEAKKLLTDWFGFDFTKPADRKAADDEIVLTADDVKELEKAFARGRLDKVAARITAEKAGISWTSGAHTALPVLTTAQGVGGETFVGFFENTGIAARLKAFYP